MGYEKDMTMVVHALADELEGVQEYTKAMETCEDPNLRKALAEILLAEKRHAHTLLSWLTSKAEYLLK